MRPALVLDPDHDLRIVTEEQFGPALPVIPYDNEARGDRSRERHVVGAVLVGLVGGRASTRCGSRGSCAPV